MMRHNPAGQVLLQCTDRPTNEELAHRRDIAQAFATKGMHGTLTFHEPSTAVWVDGVDHREYLIELIGFALMISNQNFDTTFSRSVLLSSHEPLGPTMVAQLFAVRRMVIGADIVQEIGAMEFDDPGLFRACFSEGGRPVITVNAGRFGFVDITLAPGGVRLKSARSGRRVLRKHAAMRAVAKRLGAETPEQAALVLEGIAHQVLLRSLDEPRFSSINPAPVT